MANLRERIGGLGFVRARRLLTATGLIVLAVVVATLLARGVDDVEVAATVLFVPVFLAFVFGGPVGGVVGAVVAIAVYAALRAPAVDVVGGGEYTGLLVSRAAAYLLFGAVGGWSTRVLEESLDKLQLVDRIDDATGLNNARHLLLQTDLERSRVARYRTMFSVVVLDVPAAPLDALRPRRRRQVLRELGRHLGASVRNVDHVVHARDGELHRLVAILPETAAEGAEVFRGRFEDRVVALLGDRGIDVTAGVRSSTCTLPGDDERLEALRVRFAELDEREHGPRAVEPATRT